MTDHPSFDNYADLYAYHYQLIVDAGQEPVKAVFDPVTGGCTVCGGCSTCPGWHTCNEVKDDHS